MVSAVSSEANRRFIDTLEQACELRVTSGDLSEGCTRFDGLFGKTNTLSHEQKDSFVSFSGLSSSFPSSSPSCSPCSSPSSADPSENDVFSSSSLNLLPNRSTFSNLPADHLQQPEECHLPSSSRQAHEDYSTLMRLFEIDEHASFRSPAHSVSRQGKIFFSFPKDEMVSSVFEEKKEGSLRRRWRSCDRGGEGVAPPHIHPSTSSFASASSAAFSSSSSSPPVFPSTPLWTPPSSDPDLLRFSFQPTLRLAPLSVSPSPFRLETFAPLRSELESEFCQKHADDSFKNLVRRFNIDPHSSHVSHPRPLSLPSPFPFATPTSPSSPAFATPRPRSRSLSGTRSSTLRSEMKPRRVRKCKGPNRQHQQPRRKWLPAPRNNHPQRSSKSKPAFQRRPPRASATKSTPAALRPVKSARSPASLQAHHVTQNELRSHFTQLKRSLLNHLTI